MPDSVPFVAMIGYAYQIAQLQIVDSSLFTHFTQSCDTDVFAGILMSFRKVPKSVSAYQQIVSSSISDQTSTRIYFEEFSFDKSIGSFDVVRWYIYAMERSRCLEKGYQSGNIIRVTDRKTYGV